MAKKTAQVDVKVTGSKSLQDIENELSKINDELSTMDVNSQAFADMAKQAQVLDGELQGVNQQLSYISPAEQADGFLKMGEGIFGAVAAVEGLSAAFGVQNEAVEETVRKLVGMLTAMDGIRKVSEALQRENLVKLTRGFQNMGNAVKTGFKNVGKAFNATTESMGKMVKATKTGTKIMKISLASIGIGLIIAGITAVIANWDKLVGIFKKGSNGIQEGFDDLTDSITSTNQELLALTNNVDKLASDLEELSKITGKDLFDSTALQDYNAQITVAEVALSRQAKGSLGFLVKERELIKKRIQFQKEYNKLTREGLEKTLEDYGGFEKLLGNITILEDKELRATKDAEIAQARYNGALEDRNKAEKDWEYLGLSKSRITKKLKQQDADLVTSAEAVAAANEQLVTIQDDLNSAKEIYGTLSDSSIENDNTIKLNQLHQERIANQKTINDLINKRNLAIREGNMEINQVVDTTKLDENRKKLLEQEVKEINFNLPPVEVPVEVEKATLEQMINEIGNAVANIAVGASDLFAAQQEEIIALAQLEMDANQEVIDAEIDNQNRLQDQINENNNQILTYEDLLKDANAERFAEIQAAIAEEEAANRDLEAQRQEAALNEEASLKEQAALQFEIAHAEWEIRKADLITSEITASINAALAIINALAAPFPLNTILPPLIAAASGLQIAAIGKQIGTINKTEPQPPKAEEGMLVGASHDGGGIPIEAEGGEFIINKNSTSRFLPLIEAINNSGRPKYAEGGQVPMPSAAEATAIFDYDLLAYKIKQGIQPVVSVVEITDRQNKVKVIEANASF